MVVVGMWRSFDVYYCDGIYLYVVVVVLLFCCGGVVCLGNGCWVELGLG